MPCSKEEALVRLFYNLSSSFHLFFIFFYISVTFLFKFLNFVGSNPIFPRNRNGIEYNFFSDEEEEIMEEEKEEEEEEEEDQRRRFVDRFDQHQSTENDHLVADIIRGGEKLLFLPKNTTFQRIINHQSNVSDEFLSPHESISSIEDQNENRPAINRETSSFEHESSISSSPRGSEYDYEVTDSVPNSVPNNSSWSTSPITIDLRKSNLEGTNDKSYDEFCDNQNDITHENKVEMNFPRDENFLVFPDMEKKKLLNKAKQKELMQDEEVYGDSCTIGSTSKSSSEWRSSINCRDSGTEDPFSSSSRRSCPKWESYTVFQKYDEEMLFLDRISAQKLHETESLKSIQVCPRSISERIVHKIATINKKPSDIRQNPYHELEAAYVAQICLTWEALNWNYKNFHQKRASRKDFDPGCLEQIAQQFQQFQVLLQRYIENEPYEQGRRPEIYARMRLLAPKLLQVPEYRDNLEDDQKEGGLGGRISSAAFVTIMEDCIRTFMNFLKADKENPCQVLKNLFKRKRRGSVDPTLINLMKKVNQKKNLKLKDLRRSRKCLRKRRLKVDEEMEILMAQIDLKVASRVLRMKDLSEEQLHWCEEKMSKVRVLEGKLQRDSSTLFFPAH
ncbi:uncharacterized protein LOC107418785 isoform X1 [Ziziphus jujuba]|uniref:Uncharacterized protein LOC107418785 isoform X1 n=1 Tax=Ziziphus jujuba TaxID=326968 RepID=A0A6P3ZSV0_ZIZJJ|nr:uncharacterized protein LOC107418785 isoform X1 [Ziziphus jujuba]